MNSTVKKKHIIDNTGVSQPYVNTQPTQQEPVLPVMKGQPKKAILGGVEVEGTFAIPIAQIKIPQVRARGAMSEEGIKELSESIRKFGVIEPIVVRRIQGGYQLIAGERRLTASKDAGLDTIASVVYNLPDGEAILATAIENIQREDADPIALAQALQASMKMLGVTESAIAGQLGKSKGWVSLKLALLNLTPKVQSMVSHRALSEEQALPIRELQNPKAMDEFADIVVQNQWNRDMVRSYVRQMLSGKAPEVTQPQQLQAPMQPPTSEICPMCGASKPFGEVVPRSNMCASCWDRAASMLSKR